jgi:diadenylate cyclase
MIRAITNYIDGLLHSAAYSPGRIAFELFLIGFVVYTVLRFLRGTRGARLLQGIVILVAGGFLVVNVLADWFDLERIKILYQPFVWTVLLTTLVVFQPELRRGLMRLGETRWRRTSQSEIDKISRPIATACGQLSKNKIGALIAVERDIGLSGLIDQGVPLDARLTSELLLTIFWPGSVLHDLGVIIQRTRVAAAGCQFPLGDAEGLDRSIGSRHRAAIGLSLDSDAIVVVVSEETGSISIAERGRLYRHIQPDAMFATLRRHLSQDRGPRRAKKKKGDEATKTASKTSTTQAKSAGSDNSQTAIAQEELPKAASTTTTSASTGSKSKTRQAAEAS